MHSHAVKRKWNGTDGDAVTNQNNVHSDDDIQTTTNHGGCSTKRTRSQADTASLALQDDILFIANESTEIDKVTETIAAIDRHGKNDPQNTLAATTPLVTSSMHPVILKSSSPYSRFFTFGDEERKMLGLQIGVHTTDGTYSRCFYIAASRALGMSLKCLRKYIENGLRSFVRNMTNVHAAADILYLCGLDIVRRISADSSQSLGRIPDPIQSVENFIAQKRHYTKWTWGGTDDMHILSLLSGFQMRFVTIDTTKKGMTLQIPHSSTIDKYRCLFRHHSQENEQRLVFLHYRNYAKRLTGEANHYDLVVFRNECSHVVPYLLCDESIPNKLDMISKRIAHLLVTDLSEEN